jgi:arginase
LAARYGDDLAILWIDSHLDIGTPASEYPGYHAMAVAALTGHGDSDVLSLLPAIVAPERVALIGLHSWTEDDYPNVAEWGIRSFSPDDLRQSSEQLLDWPATTGCTRWQSISTLTPSTAMKSCWGWARSPAGSPALRCAGSLRTRELPLK